MNILVVPTTDWTHNPTPNRLNFIFDRLSERGHNVDVIHFNMGCYKNTTPRDTKCNLIPVGGFDIKDQSLYYILNSPFIFKTMYKVAKTNHYDVVVAANILPAMYANLLGIPVVHDYLDHWEESASLCYGNTVKSPLVKFVVNKISKYNLHHACAIITVSEGLRWLILCDFLNFPEKNSNKPSICVISNGVDTSALYPVDKTHAKNELKINDKFVIGYVGSLEPWVDFELLFDGISGIGDKNVKMLIVGSSLYGDYLSYLKKLVGLQGSVNDVIFTGSVKYGDLYKYISAMDVGVNPLKKLAKNDLSLGGKIFNYLACGVPVLSTYGDSVGKIAAVYPNTVFFPTHKNFVESALELPKLDGGNCEYRRRISKKFDWNKLASDYEGVLESVVKGEIKNG